ncbi:MAG: YbhB/YbcL family Raf kinase inhibitor-like protein [Spirochaetes bacterium]|jgi:Raf kinase inhibitor-like YbhB/YbcL family protein|nr:YbhB/YbcL family Raf kinase inhibitor-like protein [Spirochaetota bacterium]
MHITSSAFEHNERIPAKYTCNGQNINPPLRIEDIPPGTQSMAIIVDDPDAPGKTFLHWLIWDIEPTNEIGENTAPGTQGRTDFGKPAYGGPCPPSGTHRYFFRVYALGTTLGLPEGSSRADLEQAMKGHVLAEAEIIGLYAQS